MPSIQFGEWKEKGKRYYSGGGYIYKYSVSVEWTVKNDLDTAIFLSPRITGFGVDTGRLQGHVVNPGQTYSGSCGHEFDWIEGAEDDVTIEYVYSLTPDYSPPYYPLGSATKHIKMPPYSQVSEPGGSPPPSEAPPKFPIANKFISWWRVHPKWRNIREVIGWLRSRPKIFR